MKGSIVKRGKSYSVVIDAGRDENGKRVRRWHSGIRTKREAEALRVELLSAQAGGTYTAPNKLTVREFAAKQWLPSIEALVAGGSMKPSTASSYRCQVNTHIVPQLGSVLLRDLTGPMLNAFYGRLLTSGRVRVKEGGSPGLSPTSCHLVHVTVHRMLKDAGKWGLVARNVADLADAPRPTKSGEDTMTTWTPEQLRAFLAAVDGDRLQAMWLLFITTGLRRGEVSGLRWSDVDLDAGRLRVTTSRTVVDHLVVEGAPKTSGSRREIGLDPATVASLRSHWARQSEERLLWGPAYTPTGHLFTWEDGRAIHPNIVSKTFQRLAARAGLPVIRLHDLRHSYATAALEAGVALKVVSTRLGHSSISITGDIYCHVRAEVDQAAADLVAGSILGVG